MTEQETKFVDFLENYAREEDIEQVEQCIQNRDWDAAEELIDRLLAKHMRRELLNERVLAYVFSLANKDKQ
jgi:enolase